MRVYWLPGIPAHGLGYLKSDLLLFWIRMSSESKLLLN